MRAIITQSINYYVQHIQFLCRSELFSLLINVFLYIINTYIPKQKENRLKHNATNDTAYNMQDTQLKHQSIISPLFHQELEALYIFAIFQHPMNRVAESGKKDRVGYK